MSLKDTLRFIAFSFGLRLGDVAWHLVTHRPYGDICRIQNLVLAAMVTIIWAVREVSTQPTKGE